MDNRKAMSHEFGASSSSASGGDSDVYDIGKEIRKFCNVCARMRFWIAHRCLQAASKLAAAATKASNGLPKTGGDFEVYNTNAVFAALMKTENQMLTDLCVFCCK
jgi:hypothetical protein